VAQVVQFFLNRSAEIDKKLNGFDHLTETLALQQAESADLVLEGLTKQKTKDGVILFDFENLITRQPLFGIPYAIKAIIQAENEVFNASSKVLDNFHSPYSSTVYNKVQAVGAILLGVANMDQFAMGASGESSNIGPAYNPFDPSRVPGGSSSGSCVVVASGQVVFSLGTDTGGSIRQPAAFCDLVGLKPTYGLVSRWGVIPMASSLDQVGGIANTVEDSLIVNKVLAGQDPKDQTTLDSRELNIKLESLITKRHQSRQVKKITKSLKPIRIGLPKEFFVDGIDPIIAKAMSDLIKKLGGLGHTIIETSIPTIDQAIAVYYLTMSVEVAANLERIDGIRYAAQQDKYKDLFFEHRGQYLGDEVKRRIILGTYASSSGYYDAYYNQAQKVRELTRRDFERAFQDCDLLLTPTTPEFPFPIGSKTSDPLTMYLSDIFTAGINPVRLPAMNVPLGLFDVPVIDSKQKQDSTQSLENVSDAVENDQSVSHSDIATTVRLPTGCQIIGPELSEDLIYELAFEIENLVKKT